MILMRRVMAAGVVPVHLADKAYNRSFARSVKL
jgi:hypothetical protein